MALFAALFHSELLPQLQWNLCDAGVCPVITPIPREEGGLFPIRGQIVVLRIIK